MLTLSWSRAFWGEPVLDLGRASLRRSLVRAADYFGGVTRQWLFDNPKTVVIERDGDRVRFHPELLELASHYHVEPRVCVPRKPNQKGRVERMSATFGIGTSRLGRSRASPRARRRSGGGSPSCRAFSLRASASR